MSQENLFKELLLNFYRENKLQRKKQIDLDIIFESQFLFPSQFIIELNVLDHTIVRAKCSELGLGYSVQELASRNFLDLVTLSYKSDFKAFITNFAQNLQNTAYKHVESSCVLELHTKDNAKAIALLQITPFKLNGGDTIESVLLKGDLVSNHFLLSENKWLISYKQNNALIHKEFSSSANVTPFSTRELEILKMINEGMKSKEIAKTLSISINTVNNHRASLLEKSKTRNSVELLGYARTNRIL